MNKWDDPDEEMHITKDLYEVLGVERDASDSQIKRAYHKLAMVHHPDKRAANPEGSDDAGQGFTATTKKFAHAAVPTLHLLGERDSIMPASRSLAL